MMISIISVKKLALFFLVAIFPCVLCAEDIWLADNSHYYGLVKGINEKKELKIQIPDGQVKYVSLEKIIAIRFMGRQSLLIQTGTQEFHFVNGGKLRGQILKNEGNLVFVKTAMAGNIDINLSRLKGFLALPLIGFSGRKAEELVQRQKDKTSANLDRVLDRRGSVYPGVVKKLSRTRLDLDHEDLLQVVPIKISYIAGVRLAESTRDPKKRWEGKVQLRITGRDGSVLVGMLEKIYLQNWYLRPVWNEKKLLKIPLDEIWLVQIQGGKVQYLSQLVPEKTKEKTVLTPIQKYKMDKSCQGDPISIAGKRYPWGIGVHSNSEITFNLNGRFKNFLAEVGIASQMGKRGSVVFTVLGDGKTLYKSKVIRGSAKKPTLISVKIDGIKKLTLKVTDAGDLDLGDVANWGSARVLR